MDAAAAAPDSSRPYGSPSYWDKRYSEEGEFDWLCSYADVAPLIERLVPRAARILMAGAGSAPFSPDLYRAGYRDILNADTSAVCMDRMRQRYPEQRWEVLDCMDLKTVPDGSMDAVIDKSLIDTLLCYENSGACVQRMLLEAERVLGPGGRYVALSLHSKEDVLRFFDGARHEWTLESARIRNPRWDEGENSRRSVAHTLVVCTKPLANGSPSPLVCRKLPGTLSEEEYQALERRARHINSSEAVLAAGVDDLMAALESALVQLEEDDEATPGSSGNSLDPGGDAAGGGEDV